MKTPRAEALGVFVVVVLGCALALRWRMEDPTLVEIVSVVKSARPLSFWRMALAVAAGLWLFAFSLACIAAVLVLLGLWL